MADEIVASECLPYYPALEWLQGRWQASPEEFTVWVALGDIPTYDDEGGRCWVRDALPVWSGSPAKQWDAVKSELLNCRFRPSDLEAFEPGERWLTHAQLLERWAASLGTEEARLFIEAKAQTGGLLPVYPITGFEVEYPEHGVFRWGAVESLEPDLPEPRKPAKGEPPQFLTAQAIAKKLSRDRVEIDAICARLLEAVQSGNLSAEVALRKPGATGGFEPITSITQIRQIHDYSLGHSWVMVTIHRKDYLPWAARNEFKVPDDWQEEAPQIAERQKKPLPPALAEIPEAATENAKMKPTDVIRANLAALIEEIEQRAAAKEMPFDQSAMPGRKVDFQWLAEKREVIRVISPKTFFDYLPGICKFKSGARETDFYRRLFPEYGVSSASS